MDFETRSATPNDRDDLYQLYASVMKAHINKIWGWDEAWQQTDFDTHFVPSTIQVAVVDNRIVAYIQTELCDGTPHVRMICVASEYQNNGIGSALLKAFIHNCSAKQQDVTLGVFKINTDAHRFYERLGFKIIEEASNHYLMKRKA